MSQPFIEIELEEEPIELCKLLKVLDLVEGGGHAKLLIQDGYVAVNDEVCTQKRRKIYSGDTLFFDGELFKLTLAEGATPTPRPTPVSSAPVSSTPQSQNTEPAKKKRKKSNVDNKTGRKPISFG